MKLLSTWFFAAMAFNSASACASLSGAGIAIGWLRAMARGTMASISARRDAAPITDSMCCSSAASGPMWRATNSAAFSSSPSGFRADISMGGFRAGAQGRVRSRQSVFSSAS